MAKALVYIENANGKAKKASLEAVYALSSQGVEVHALAIGKNGASFAGDVGAQGAKKLLVLAGDAFDQYQADTFAPAVEDVAKKGAYDIIAGAATNQGKDLFPTVAAKLDAGVITDGIAIDVSSGVKVKRPMLAGKYFAWMKFKAAPAVVSLRPNALGLGSGDGAAAPVENLSFAPPARAKTIAIEGANAGAKADLSEAERIVSGGRAMKNSDNFKILNELGDVIGATVGASRAAVDSGYAPHSMQVGQTGKTVSPNLYIACGISGQIQHLAGMKTSKVIVAVNTDPEAPIFQRADYGLVGDLFEVVPKLSAEFKKLLSQG